MVFKVMTNVMLNGAPLSGLPTFSVTNLPAGRSDLTMPVYGLVAGGAVITESGGQFDTHTTMSSIFNNHRQNGNPFADMGMFVGRRADQPALAANGLSMVQFDGGHMVFSKGHDGEGDDSGTVRSAEGSIDEIGGSSFVKEEDHVLKMGGEQFKVEIYGESSYFEHPVRAGAFEALERMVVEYEKRSGKKLVWYIPAGRMEEHLRDRLDEFVPIEGADAVYARFLLGGEKEAEMGDELAKAWFNAFIAAKSILEGTKGVKNIHRAIWLIATEVVGGLVVDEDVPLAGESAAKMARRLAVLLDWAVRYQRGDRAGKVNAFVIAEAMALSRVDPYFITGVLPDRWTRLVERWKYKGLAASTVLAKEAECCNGRALWRLIKRSQKNPDDVLSREVLKYIVLRNTDLFTKDNKWVSYDFYGQLPWITKDDSSFTRELIRHLLNLSKMSVRDGNKEAGDQYFGLFQKMRAIYRDNERVMMPSFVKWLDENVAGLFNAKVVNILAGGLKALLEPKQEQ